jgi:hypothetical protein
MREADYKRMDEALDTLHIWVKKIEEKIKE